KTLLTFKQIKKMEAVAEKQTTANTTGTNRHLRKAVVLGSGVMGSRIACHFAQAGVTTLLLDIVPFNLTDEQKKDKKLRNKIVNDALAATLKANPAPLYDKAFISRITT